MSDRGRQNVSAFPNVPLLMPHAQRVADIPPERVEWLSMSRLAAGKITILDGDPGLGKSSLSLDWAARITRGDALPYGPKNRPRGVVILSAEDDPRDTIRPRLDACQADLSRVFLFDMRDEEGNSYLPSLPGDLEALASMIEATDAALTIVDPLIAYVAGELKSGSDQDMRRMLSPMGTMLARTRCAGLGLRHLNKTAAMSSLYRGGGSIGIIGAARFGLLVAKDPADETGKRRILAVQKANIGDDDPPSLVYRLESVGGTDVARVVWEGESDLRANALTAPPADEGDRSRVQGALDWLRDILGGGSVPTNELKRLAREDGFNWSSMERARDRKDSGVHVGRVGFGRGGRWVWSLSPIDPHIDAHDDPIEAQPKKPVLTPLSS